MVPLIATKSELDILKDVIDRVAEQVRRETGNCLEYLVGTMIELPRAALRAGEIAETAAFFSFGTNDLTQTTFGISRDDARLPSCRLRSAGIYEATRSSSIDLDGVGELVIDGGRTRPRHAPGASSSASAANMAATRLGRLLPQGRSGLCLLLPLPRTHRAAGSGTGGDCRREELRLSPIN